ncbi:MAG TPA: glycoside hydrolase family 9 protein [Opitutaceae bacterium]|nr:glycoside hydrolase family 9 protein [Opitutaceae bacterium]
MLRRLPWFAALAGLVGVLGSPRASAAGAPLPWSVPALSGVTIPGLPPVTGHIHVDQFGYLPDEQKVAVLSDPQRGFNAADHFAPGPVLEVRQAAGGAVIFQGAPARFNRGKIDALSGDRGWWFDFSGVQQPGQYYIFDPKLGRRSHVFRVAPDAYGNVLRAAVRVFYYQREATAHVAPWAEVPWQDGPSFLQDRETRAVWAKNDPATARDLSGGWMDAGDTNKYPPFLGEVIHPLLYAWRANSAIFTDDFNIPESGNGLPDLLDEVKWELDWLVKMQDADGGVFIKMGDIDYHDAWPPSADRGPRYYGPKCSASTIATAGVFAHAARVYGRFAPWQAFAADLRARAERAWSWYSAHPRSYDCDTGELKAGSANLDAAAQDRAEAVAALHLWVLTGQSRYHDAFKQKVGTMRQLADEAWSGYEMGQAEMLFDYVAQPGADRATRERITDAFVRSTHSRLFMPQKGADQLYRAGMPENCYHWGSNQILAGYGIAASAGAEAGLAGPQRELLRQRALDLLHALHGVNPLDLVYLTNMGRCGAESSIVHLYHGWFRDVPPPGYVVGGPNPQYGGNLAWVKRQPAAKAYADFNEGWPANSWELTEPAIYYQAAYIRLLAAFVRPPAVEIKQ